jgi:hypothetical protein
MVGARTLEAQIKDGTAKVQGDVPILARLTATIVDFDPRFEVLPGTRARGGQIAPRRRLRGRPRQGHRGVTPGPDTSRNPWTPPRTRRARCPRTRPPRPAGRARTRRSCRRSRSRTASPARRTSSQTPSSRTRRRGAPPSPSSGPIMARAQGPTPTPRRSFGLARIRRLRGLARQQLDGVGIRQPLGDGRLRARSLPLREREGPSSPAGGRASPSTAPRSCRAPLGQPPSPESG